MSHAGVRTWREFVAKAILRVARTVRLSPLVGPALAGLLPTLLPSPFSKARARAFGDESSGGEPH